jgi:hypothetical protein
MPAVTRRSGQLAGTGLTSSRLPKLKTRASMLASVAIQRARSGQMGRFRELDPRHISCDRRPNQGALTMSLRTDD